MEKIYEFNFNGYEIYAIGNLESVNKVIVLFIHGIPGDRVDSRRLPVRIARLLCDSGIATLRIDLYATSFSRGAYEEVTLSLYKQCMSFIINSIKDRYSVSNFILVVFSEAGKVAMKLQSEISVNGICFCNAILAKEENVDELSVNRFYRKNNNFVVDIKFGVWINIKLIKEIRDWCVDKTGFLKNRYLFIYGAEDKLTQNTRDMIKNIEGEKILLEQEDHLFTSGRNDERIACEILRWIREMVVN